jgi:hypothetical protein
LVRVEKGEEISRIHLRIFFGKKGKDILKISMIEIHADPPIYLIKHPPDAKCSSNTIKAK